MGAGDEFTVGSLLNHTGNTRKGKVYTFVDNLDTTGTIQAVLDAEQTWDNTDNITDADGGDAELSENARAVGFIIDREYAGVTVTGVDGKFQIEEDEDYATRPDVGALRATWDADALDLPIIDFNNESYQLNMAGDDFYIFTNMEFKDSTDDLGIIYFNGLRQVTLFGVLFKQSSSNRPCFTNRDNHLVVKRFTAEGSGAGVGQTLMRTQTIMGVMSLIDGAIYNMGDTGINTDYKTMLINMNIGVEQLNGDDDIAFDFRGDIFGKNVKLGGTNGFISRTTNNFSGPLYYMAARFENYQKVLGDHRTFYPGGIFQRSAVAGETPNKKLSDFVMKIIPNVDYTYKYEEGQCVLLSMNTS
jgi:hypothetical protein